MGLRPMLKRAPSSPNSSCSAFLRSSSLSCCSAAQPSSLNAPPKPSQGCEAEPSLTVTSALPVDSVQVPSVFQYAPDADVTSCGSGDAVEPPLAPLMPPDAVPGMPPDAEPVIPPEAVPVIPPDAEPVIPPEAVPVIPPDEVPGLPPEAEPVWPPELEPVIPPDEVPGLPPEAEPVMPPELEPV